MKPLFTLIALLISPLLSIAQLGQHANKWHFGNYCAIDFQGGSPTAIAGSPLQADEGCASISDNSGNLLFFTNGNNIWDANNNVMPNGAGVNGKLSGNNGGTASDVQAPMVLRAPGSTTQYYVFTINDNDELYYSVVDMTLGANGDVVPSQKNIFLASNIGEGLTATRHSNGVDWWMVSHSSTGNTFHVRLLSGAGVGSPNSTSLGLSGFRNHMKISYDGSYLGHSISGIGSQLLDFNSTNGSISNARTLTTSSGNYLGTEFSPSSQYFYTTEDQELYRYDVTASPVSSSRTLMSTLTGGIPLSYGTLQLAPDGKIYIAKLGLFAYNDLAAISNPDSPAATVNNSAVSHTGTSLLGLPQYYELVDLLVLPIELLSFSAEKKNSISAIHWTTATEINNDYFIVEHSTDAIHFKPILSQSGAGNSQTTLRYYDEDLSPSIGDNYYRLKQVDFDGKHSYSHVEHVFHDPIIDFTFGPNPVVKSGELQLNLLQSQNINITITDIKGRIVMQQQFFVVEGSQTIAINLSTLSKGMYLLNLSGEFIKTSPLKLIKQ